MPPHLVTTPDAFLGEVWSVPEGIERIAPPTTAGRRGDVVASSTFRTKRDS